MTQEPSSLAQLIAESKNTPRDPNETVHQTQESFYQPGDWTAEERSEFNQLAQIYQGRADSRIGQETSEAFDAAADLQRITGLIQDLVQMPPEKIIFQKGNYEPNEWVPLTGVDTQHIQTAFREQVPMLANAHSISLSVPTWFEPVLPTLADDWCGGMELVDTWPINPDAKEVVGDFGWKPEVKKFEAFSSAHASWRPLPPTTPLGDAFFPPIHEVVVQPRFKHIVNLPILAKMNILELEEAPSEIELSDADRKLDELIEELELHPELAPPVPTGQPEHDLSNLRHYKHFIVVSGTRYYCDLKQFHRVMCIYLLRLKGPVLFISGKAPSGADDLIIRWAKKFGYPCLEMPADWDTNGKAAGFIRNVAMANLATGVLAFWDEKSKGTSHMIEISVERSLPTKVVKIETPSRERWYAMLRKREVQDALEAEKKQAAHTGEELVTLEISPEEKNPDMQAYLAGKISEIATQLYKESAINATGPAYLIQDEDEMERLRNGEVSVIVFSEPVISAAAEDDGDDVPDASLAITEINEDD